MKLLSEIMDERINSNNLIYEITVGEYLSFAEKIIKNNDLQRGRVKTSKTIYALLVDDYLEGCIIPPIVLAYSGKIDSETYKRDDFSEFLTNNSSNLLILDGLQRTYTMIEAVKKATSDEIKLMDFRKRVLRVELYVDINRFGILYRMLTLNTGQTPMSIRHQIEMLYSELKDKKIEGVKLISDKEGKANPNNNEIKFVDAIESFSSYMTRSELKIDRIEILDNIKMLEKISKENMNQDTFVNYINLYMHLFKTMNEISDVDSFESDIAELELKGNPFGKSTNSIFSSSQSMTGFGAAVGKMIDRNVIKDFNEVLNIIEIIKEKNDGNEGFMALLETLDRISHSAKKIGNEQRLFFAFFYRELFNQEGDAFSDITKAVEYGYEKYYSQVS